MAVGADCAFKKPGAIRKIKKSFFKLESLITFFKDTPLSLDGRGPG
jgi:hypothetical protein